MGERLAQKAVQEGPPKQTSESPKGAGSGKPKSVPQGIPPGEESRYLDALEKAERARDE